MHPSPAGPGSPAPSQPAPRSPGQTPHSQCTDPPRYGHATASTSSAAGGDAAPDTGEAASPPLPQAAPPRAGHRQTPARRPPAHQTGAAATPCGAGPLRLAPQDQPTPAENP